MVSGTRHVRLLPARAARDWALDPADLAAAVEADLAAGLIPFYLVATFGTTSSCAVDPLRPLGELAARHGMWCAHRSAARARRSTCCHASPGLLLAADAADSGYLVRCLVRGIAAVCRCQGVSCMVACATLSTWRVRRMHVDAAYAGVAALLPEQRAGLDGLELADSFDTNCHKCARLRACCAAHPTLWHADRHALSTLGGPSCRVAVPHAVSPCRRVASPGQRRRPHGTRRPGAGGCW